MDKTVSSVFVVVNDDLWDIFHIHQRSGTVLDVARCDDKLPSCSTVHNFMCDSMSELELVKLKNINPISCQKLLKPKSRDTSLNCKNNSPVFIVTSADHINQQKSQVSVAISVDSLLASLISSYLLDQKFNKGFLRFVSKEVSSIYEHLKCLPPKVIVMSLVWPEQQIIDFLW